MVDLFEILPMAILYLSCGFTFLCGFYLLIDRRFDFFSDISFSIMLVLGFLINMIVEAIPYDFGLRNDAVRSVLLVVVSFGCGICIAILRNRLGSKAVGFVIKYGRRKSSSENFWYDILDEKDKPVWIRLTNIDKKYILDGLLLSLSESKENPYLLLGDCQKYDVGGNPVSKENVNSKDRYVQEVGRPDSYDEITVFYADGSAKGIELEIIDREEEENETGCID